MSTGNLRILATNLHDTATLTATSEAMPITNTQRSERAYVWRSTDLTPQVIEGVLPSGGFVDCFAVDKTNLDAGGTVQVELFSNNVLLHDSGEISTALLIPLNAWRVGIDVWGATYNERMPGKSSLCVIWLAAPAAIDKYRITFRSTGPASYIEAGRVFVGLSFSPETNMSWSPKVQWLENIEHKQTEGGSLRSSGSAHPRRSFGIKLDWLSPADCQRLLTELVSVGMGADLLVSLYPGKGGLDELQHTMICRRNSSYGNQYTHLNNYSAALDFLEV